MLVLLGEMLVEAHVKEGVIESMRARCPRNISRDPPCLFWRFTIPISLVTRITFELFVWLVISRCSLYLPFL